MVVAFFGGKEDEIVHAEADVLADDARLEVDLDLARGGEGTLEELLVGRVIDVDLLEFRKHLVLDRNRVRPGFPVVGGRDVGFA